MTTTKQREMHSAFEKVKGVTDAKRGKLDVWSEPCGWCSACRRDGVIAVHLGVRGVADIALCDECVDRMNNACLEEMALQTGSVDR